MLTAVFYGQFVEIIFAYSLVNVKLVAIKLGAKCIENHQSKRAVGTAKRKEF